MAIVYRLEARDEKFYGEIGVGPYNGMCSAIRDEFCMSPGSLLTNGSASESSHPLPYCDPGMMEWWNTSHEMYNYVFCFASAADLHRWFYKIPVYGAALNPYLCIGVYQVPDEYHQRGSFQSAAHKKHMVRLETWDITRTG